MFGNQSDQHKKDDNQVRPEPAATVAGGEQPSGAPGSGNPAWQHPGKPLDADTDEHDLRQPEPDTVIAPATHPVTAPVHDLLDTSSDVNDLIDIKQHALAQLSPLVGHLDQTPEEKFRTTMMMIQASDDQSLVKSAYDSAQAITDEKTRAQALLDIINEINYFTQHHQN